MGMKLGYPHPRLEGCACLEGSSFCGTNAKPKGRPQSTLGVPPGLIEDSVPMLTQIPMCCPLGAKNNDYLKVDADTDVLSVGEINYPV